MSASSLIHRAMALFPVATIATETSLSNGPVRMYTQGKAPLFSIKPPTAPTDTPSLAPQQPTTLPSSNYRSSFSEGMYTRNWVNSFSPRKKNTSFFFLQTLTRPRQSLVFYTEKNNIVFSTMRRNFLRERLYTSIPLKNI